MLPKFTRIIRAPPAPTRSPPFILDHAIGRAFKQSEFLIAAPRRSSVAKRNIRFDRFRPANFAIKGPTYEYQPWSSYHPPTVRRDHQDRNFVPGGKLFIDAIIIVIASPLCFKLFCTLRAPRGFAGRLNRREQECDQNADNRNNDQQFHQRESPFVLRIHDDIPPRKRDSGLFDHFLAVNIIS